MTQTDLADSSPAAPATEATGAASAPAAPTSQSPAGAEKKPRLGRKRDHTRDTDILEAALDVLAETGYDGMTIDMVATRAKAGKATLYRRWASKSDLVLDAVACMKSKDLDLAALPDTGSLRGDLVALVRPPSIRDAERKLNVMTGVVSMIARDPEMAAAAQEAIVAPRAAANRAIFERAIERGEISADVDLDTLSTIAPAMAAFRTLILRRSPDRDFLIGIIDNVVLPAAKRGAPTS
ncbi:TetR family transcriptional regulator [Pseudoclavibacter sp. RFBJ3]|uniref:TetR/AcrR family transcriptional regulator n=1 Tax=unclassified Pseudoclavibacter TaxID=2615177 RepID=UPI000CE8E184|nr:MULTISPECIES: TetR/AcrR family transcriptional regulator [unclassified Pseudoclavibacter]MBF4550542.1 TetR/AcrR family transcriptional regulator [Pseudoclavibacter sp. VKM Ac-2888]PPF35362.1 TetR family transcriptional regulator [Pseudoclavibacter sp. AY1H1]PPF86575.1 TetR family transcriptional regulator [Pseudoclavibacter sp. RFBJ5]PPF95308.1 TetR family transcriptional regulator [Pseudoclavibacter sp. RFBJ3]PPF97742.1 TetR family transcriptional regulator [Pseudoclavibacter sp. RFBH5]